MYKKIFVFFCIFIVSIFSFIGCTELINANAKTEIRINLDLSKIIKLSRNEELDQNAPSISSKDYLLKVFLYDATNFDENTRYRPTNFLISECQEKINNGTANIKFDNVTIGSNVIIFADLYEISSSDEVSTGNNNLIYSGDSTVFTVSPYNNKINIVLKKVQIDDNDDEPEVDNPPESGEKPNPEEPPVVEPEIPTILNQPENILKVFATETESNGIKNAQLSCSAFVTDGGTLSFDWFYINQGDNSWFKKDDSETTNEKVKISTISVDANLGETKIFYCVITNTLGDKKVSIYSNYVTVSCVVGELSSFTAKYTGDYETYGFDFNEIRNNIEITEYYKDAFDNVATLTYKNPSVDKYSFDVNSGYDSCIGYVPFTIKELSLNSNQEIIIPVKYQFKVDNFDLELCYNKDDADNCINFTQTESNSTIQVPQYVTSFNYQYFDETIPSFICETNSGNENVKDFNLKEITNVSAISKNGNITMSNGDLLKNVGNNTYSLTISTISGSNEWFVSQAVSKDFNVEVLPWQINFTSVDTNNFVSANNLKSGDTYSLTISNQAWPTDKDLFTTTFSGDGVEENLLIVPYSGITSINSIYLDQILATVDIKVEPLVAQTPTIITQPQSMVEVYDEETCPSVSTELSCSASVNDGGDLSFEWYYRNNQTDVFEILDTESVETISDNVVTSTISVEANKGEILYFYCKVSNSKGENTSFVQSNTATVACSEGVLSSFYVEYVGNYELWGTDIIADNIKITEIYINNITGDLIEVSYKNPSSDKYSINANTNQESYIGYVEYQVTNISLQITRNIEVPVKYQLDADMFNYEFVYTEDETILFDSTDNVLVPQYFTNLSYEYLGEVVPTNVREQNGEVSEFDIDDNLVITLNSEYGNNFDTTGTSVYTVTISSNASFAWILGSAIKDFNVQVCPWQIRIKDSTGSDVSPSQITFDTTYSLNLFNDALQEDTILPDITFDGDGVVNDRFTLPESGFSTIFVNCNEKQIATIEVKPVLVGINVSFPTYSDIDGLTYTTNGSIVTFSVANNYSSYEWFIDFEKQDNSTFIYSLNTEDMDGGIYAIMLIVTDESGNTYSAEYQLEIRK